VNVSAKFFLHLVGIAPTGESDLAQSEEELRLLLSRGTVLTSTGKSISLRAIELRNRTVREVMVPRTSIVFLSTIRSIEENMARAIENQFTRYLLCQKDLDNILGMVHIKDLFRFQGATGPGSCLLEVKRDVLFVPETISVERLLNQFLARRILMAVAVDEYGGTAGIVTLEDVLEELVGEIRDEFDNEPAHAQKISDGEYLVDGSMPLHSFARIFGISPESKDVVTVSGYVIQLLGRVPEKGASVRIGSWKAGIESVDRQKVKTIRMVKHSSAESTSGGRGKPPSVRRNKKVSGP
jgi:CBS domain containing-hemolysin-like protein